MKKVRQAGFTILELVLWIAVMASVWTACMILMANLGYKKQGKDLALSSKTYADLYAHYIYDMRESALYTMNADGVECNQVNPFTNNVNTYTLTLDDLKVGGFGRRYTPDKQLPVGVFVCRPLPNNYWNELLTGTNHWHQKPCVTIIKDPAGNYQSFMYWANSAGSQRLNPKETRAAYMALSGAGGGYVKDGMVYGQGWRIPVADIVNDRCGGTLENGNIVMNLNEYSSNNALNGKMFLARESDDLHAPNTNSNENTAKTDILMNGNKIVFDSTNNVTMQYKPNESKLVVTGAVIAQGLQALELADTGTYCSESEVSFVKQQGDKAVRDLGLQTATVVCSNAPVICRLYGSSDTCYLPTKKGTIRYTDFGHTGKLNNYGTSESPAFLCPNAIPYASNATAWQSDGGTAKVTNLGYKFSGYNIIHGATAAVDLSSSCLTWSVNVKRSVTWGGAAQRFCLPDSSWFNVTRSCSNGSTISDDGGCRAWSIPCDGKTTGGRSQANNWKCTQYKTAPKVVLETVTCSNKYFIEQQ